MVGSAVRLLLTSPRDISPHLTSLAPQPAHQPALGCRFPWSEGFDRIFRNEGVTGSNPVSSTKRPGQGDVGEFKFVLLFMILPGAAPQRPHRMERQSTSQVARCSRVCKSSSTTTETLDLESVARHHWLRIEPESHTSRRE